MTCHLPQAQARRGMAGLASSPDRRRVRRRRASPAPAKPPEPAAEQKAFLDDLAGRLNVTRDQLDTAIKGAAADEVDAAVTAGRLTKAAG